MSRHLTIEEARQRLWRFFRREARMPSYREMCLLFGYHSKNSAFKMAKRLIEAGVIRKTKDGQLVPKKLSIPLKLLGSIQAGFPTDAEEDLIDTLSLDEYLIENPNASFLLRVSGDSMIEEGIKPGDLVVVNRGRKAKNGDIVLAQIDGEWTLKFFEKKGQQMGLRAANQNYPKLLPKNELVLAGVITSVVRRYF